MRDGEKFSTDWAVVTSYWANTREGGGANIGLGMPRDASTLGWPKIQGAVSFSGKGGRAQHSRCIRGEPERTNKFIGNLGGNPNQ